MYARDEQTDIIEKYSKDADGKIQVFQTQDVKPFIEHNKAFESSTSSGFKGDWHRMASIPPIVIVMWTEELKAKGADCINPIDAKNRKFLLGKLNDPAWNKLRTKQGVI
jgi:hypothetical protein